MLSCLVGFLVFLLCLGMFGVLDWYVVIDLVDVVFYEVKEVGCNVWVGLL